MSAGITPVQRTAGVVVALAIHALLVLALVWRPAPDAPRAEDTPARPPPPPATPREDAPIDEPGAAPRASPRGGAGTPPPDPTAQARTLLARMDDSRRAALVREFGERVASIVEQPVRDAWPELAARSAEGDPRATAALVMLAAECDTSATVLAEPAQPTYDLQALAPLVPREDTRWLLVADRELDARAREKAQQCVATGAGIEAMQRVLREHGADDPLARYMIAAKPGERLQPPPELLELGDVFAALAAQMLLGSEDAAVRSRAFEYLDERGTGAPDAASAVANCYLSDACGVRRDAPAARGALERAATWGHAASVASLAKDAVALGDPATAWAWMVWEIELRDAGCIGLDTQRDVPHGLVTRLQRVAQLERDMTPAQRASARERLLAIEAAHGPRIRAALGCGP